MILDDYRWTCYKCQMNSATGSRVAAVVVPAMERTGITIQQLSNRSEYMPQSFEKLVAGITTPGLEMMKFLSETLSLDLEDLKRRAEEDRAEGERRRTMRALKVR